MTTLDDFLRDVPAPKRAALAAINPRLASASKAPTKRSPKRSAKARASATGRAAQRSGASFEARVFAALDSLVSSGVLAWWSHPPVATKRLSPTRVVVVGDALCDVLACDATGRVVVAEAKRATAGVVALDDRRGARCAVAEHQRAQLTATMRAGGVAVLVVEVRGVLAVIPWRDVRMAPAVTVEHARRYAVASLVEGIAAAVRGARGG